MDEDWALVWPSALLYGLKCWALAWYGLIFGRESHRARHGQIDVTKSYS